MTKARLHTSASRAVERFKRYLARRGLRYWGVALAILVASVIATPYVDDYLGLIQVRYWLFQQLAQISPRALQPRFATVVLIRDDDYWKGVPQGRSPIRRDYLANIVDALAVANPKVIALDFNMMLDDPSKKGTPGDYAELGDYRGETDTLIRAIARAAQTHAVVLSRSIAYDSKDGFKFVADSYQPYGICTAPGPDGTWQNPGTPDFPLTPETQANITCGYIALPTDIRLLPPRAEVAGSTIDSFALAIARAKNPGEVKRIGDNIYYGSFIPQQTLEDSGVLFSAGDVLEKNAVTLRAVKAQIAIVGGQWSTLQYGSGPLVDLHETPLGMSSGTIIHANYVEAILDGRQFGTIPDWALRVFEFLFGAFAALIFGISSNVWLKLATLAGMCVALLFTQWVMLIAFGTFFEAFLPLLGLWLHSLFERVISH